MKREGVSREGKGKEKRREGKDVLGLHLGEFRVVRLRLWRNHKVNPTKKEKKKKIDETKLISFTKSRKERRDE